MIDFILDSIRGNMIKSDRNLEIIDKRRDSMISKSQVVVRYAETDQMGIVHHSNYPVWYEIGRTDLIKETGITYSELERMGVMTPLVELSCRYIGVARYEDVLTVETSIAELTPSRIRFAYRVFKQGEDKPINTGSTLHAWVNAKTFRPNEYEKTFSRALSKDGSHQRTIKLSNLKSLALPSWTISTEERAFLNTTYPQKASIRNLAGRFHMQA